MSKEDYIRKNLDDTFRLWIGRASLWGCLLFVLLGGLDYLVTPENFPLFLRYRAVLSLLLLCGYFLTGRLNNRDLSALAYILVAGSAVAIELMILQFGGHESPYYVGMILLGIAVTGLVPARFSFHVVIAILIYVLYLVPIVLTESVANHRDFLIANTFIILIFSTMLLARYLSGHALRSELGLQYDLEQHREHLETVVQEQTAELVDTVEKLKQEITERQKAEVERQFLQGQLLQSQKMESIGRLAGGVAHDFNNILTAILSYAELTLMKLAEDHPVRSHLVSIQAASEKAATLTHQLLAFSRRQVLEMKAVDLNKVIEGMANMLSRIIGEDILLELKTEATISTIRADQGQIEQVLMNFAVNARDAMPSGGRLLIGTKDVDLNDVLLRTQETVTFDKYVMLSVADTGAGMTAEVRERIFEPFFTTKELGRGTGLGLATVYGIVKQHSGNIFVDSDPGQGTTFKVYFPIAGERGQECDKDHDLSGPLPAGTEVILVVEDDPSVRELVRQVLAPLGYKVLATAGGDDALRTSDSYDGPVDLLLTDVVMPGMNGKQLAETLRIKRPGIKVLFMSGYAHDVLSTQGMLEPGVAMIHKPFRTVALARQVRQVLDSGA
jgi:signal transduction histidine kinase/CheY-like chemotaxis protein